MKPGYQTTEFWLTVLGQVANIAAAVAGVVSWPIAAPIAASLAAVYTISRSVVKAKSND